MEAIAKTTLLTAALLLFTVLAACGGDTEPPNTATARDTQTAPTSTTNTSAAAAPETATRPASTGSTPRTTQPAAATEPPAPAATRARPLPLRRPVESATGTRASGPPYSAAST